MSDLPNFVLNLKDQGFFEHVEKKIEESIKEEMYSLCLSNADEIKNLITKKTLLKEFLVEVQGICNSQID